MIEVACYKEILSLAKTKSELDSLISTLKSFSANIFSTKAGVKEALYALLPKKYSDFILKCCEKNNIDISESVNFNKFIAGFIDYLKTVEVVTLRVSFEPSEKVLTTLYAWFQENVSGAFVIDIILDSNIVSGCSISFRGALKDYSLHNDLSKLNNQA